MSEKRKPSLKIVAEKSGKRRLRVELFEARLWPEKFRRNLPDRYRIRVNGKWVHGDHGFTVTEVTRQLRQWLVRK